MNTTTPYLHLQVHSRAEFWDDENRSVPFDFDNGAASLKRTAIVQAKEK